MEPTTIPSPDPSSTSRGEPGSGGCSLIYILIFLVYAIWHPACGTHSVHIYDDASILDPALAKKLKDALIEKSQTLGASFVLVTASEVPRRRLSVEADRALHRVDKGQFFLWRWLFPRSGHSVTYFFSGSPELLQIRYGRYMRHRARLAGVDYGPLYASLQKQKLADGTPDFIAISNRITQEVTSLDSPFYKSWAAKIATLLDEDVLPTLAIPYFDLWDGLFTTVTVDVYNLLGTRIPNYYAFAATLIFLVMVVVLFIVWGGSLLGEPIPTEVGLHYRTKSLGGCLFFLTSFALLFLTVFPVFGFLILSAGQRTEDLITTRAIGITADFAVPHEIPWYYVLLMVAVTLVGRLLSWFVALVDHEERRTILARPGGGHQPATTPDVEDHVARAFLKALVITPLAYFLLPAWAIVIPTCLFLYIGLFSIGHLIWRIRFG